MKENATIVEEAIPIVDELQVLLRSLPSAKRALRLALIFLSYLPLEVLVLWALSSGSFSGPFILVDLGLYVGVVLFLTISVALGTKRTTGSLKFEGKSLALRNQKK